MDTLAIVLVTCLSCAVLAIIFTIFAFVVNIYNHLRSTSIVAVTSSLLARVCHMTVALGLWSGMTLTDRKWSDTSCCLFLLFWMFFWLCDVSTSMCFLLYALKQENFSFKLTTHLSLVCLAWASAICISLLPVYLGNTIFQFAITEDVCTLDFIYGERVLQLCIAIVYGAVLLTLVVSLLCFWIRTRRQLRTHAIFCRVSDLDDPIHQQNLRNSTTSDDVITFSRLYRENKTRQALQESAQCHNEIRSEPEVHDVTVVQQVAREEKHRCRLTLVSQGSVEQCVFILQLRHERQTMTTIVCATILLNILPQLVENPNAFRFKYFTAISLI